MSLDGFGEFNVEKISQEDLRKASLIICGKAKNRKDAEMLLMIVGIVPTPDAKPVSIFVPGMDNRRSRRKT